MDGDRAVRISLTMALDARGYRTRSYASAAAFWKAAEWETAGCLVLDIFMPHLTGLEMQEKLAELGWHLPIIFVTGHGNVPMAVQALRRGAVDFIEKPYSIDLLVTRIDEALRLDDQRRRIEAKALDAKSLTELIQMGSPDTS